LFNLESNRIYKSISNNQLLKKQKGAIMPLSKLSDN